MQRVDKKSSQHFIHSIINRPLLSNETNQIWKLQLATSVEPFHQGCKNRKICREILKNHSISILTTDTRRESANKVAIQPRRSIGSDGGRWNGQLCGVKGKRGNSDAMRVRVCVFVCGFGTHPNCGCIQHPWIYCVNNNNNNNIISSSIGGWTATVVKGTCWVDGKNDERGTDERIILLVDKIVFWILIDLRVFY